jgi:hypothetical protein
MFTSHNVTVPAPPECPCVKPTSYSLGRGAGVFCAAGLQVRWFELVLLMRGLFEMALFLIHGLSAHLLFSWLGNRLRTSRRASLPFATASRITMEFRTAV